jgi:hypothetical protein
LKIPGITTEELSHIRYTNSQIPSILHTSNYRKLFDVRGLEIEATYKPLSSDIEPFDFVSENDYCPMDDIYSKKAHFEL